MTSLHDSAAMHPDELRRALQHRLVALAVVILVISLVAVLR
jgi:hypothetical protein